MALFGPSTPKRPFEQTAMYRDYQRAIKTPTNKKSRKRQWEARQRIQGRSKSFQSRMDRELGPGWRQNLYSDSRDDSMAEETIESAYTLMPGLTKPRVRRRTLLSGAEQNRRLGMN